MLILQCSIKITTIFELLHFYKQAVNDKLWNRKNSFKFLYVKQYVNEVSMCKIIASFLERLITVDYICKQNDIFASPKLL